MQLKGSKIELYSTTIQSSPMEYFSKGLRCTINDVCYSSFGLISLTHKLFLDSDCHTNIVEQFHHHALIDIVDGIVCKMYITILHYIHCRKS